MRIQFDATNLLSDITGKGSSRPPSWASCSTSTLSTRRASSLAKKFTFALRGRPGYDEYRKQFAAYEKKRNL
jgi:hypothetical protein